MRAVTLFPGLRSLAMAAGLATVLAGSGQTVAFAHDWGDDGWRRQEWREHEWREHERREHEWREHEWRERHRPYAYRYAPGYYAAPSYYAAPGYAYGPPAYYGAPSLNLGFSFR